jgi:hypothetical protein
LDNLDTVQASAHAERRRAVAPTTYRRRPAFTKKKEFVFKNDPLMHLIHLKMQ